MQASLVTSYGEFPLGSVRYEIKVHDGVLYLIPEKRGILRFLHPKIIGHVEDWKIKPDCKNSLNGESDESLELKVSRDCVLLTSSSEHAYFDGRRLEREELSRPERHRLCLGRLGLGGSFTVEFDVGLREILNTIFKPLIPSS